MDNTKVRKRLFVSGMLIIPISIILGRIYSLITHDQLVAVENILSYEWLLLLSLLILFSLVAYTYHLSSENKILEEKFLDTKNKSKQNKSDKISKRKKIKYLKNLKFDEREVLKLFIDQNLKTVEIGDIRFAKALQKLVRMEIIYPQLSLNPQPFTIDPDIWDYLLKHKDLLKINSG